MRNLRAIFPILALLLFVGNYQICEYFFPNNIKSWWTLKVNIYALILAFLFLYSSFNKNGIERFLLEIGVGFSISSVIDKCFYNSREFTKSDFVMIILTISIAFYNYRKNVNRH